FHELSATHRYLHSFPTRRSSDLRVQSGLGDAADLRARGDVLGVHRASDLTRLRPPLRCAETAFRHRAAALAARGRARSPAAAPRDRKSTRLNSSHRTISYAVFCL